jgi:TRAP-type C4-dicarboxylate transport system permease small subunit
MNATTNPLWVRVIDTINRVLFSVAAVAIVILMIQVILDVSGRYFFNHPIAGTLELVTYWWMPIIVFLSLGWAQRRGEHISVTLLTETLSERLSKIIWTIGDIFGLVVIGMLIVFAWQGAAKSAGVHEASLGTAVVLIWPIKIVAVIGLVSYLLQVVVTLYHRYRPEPEEVEDDLEAELLKVGIE